MICRTVVPLRCAASSIAIKIPLSFQNIFSIFGGIVLVPVFFSIDIAAVLFIGIFLYSLWSMFGKKSHRWVTAGACSRAPASQSDLTALFFTSLHSSVPLLKHYVCCSRPYLLYIRTSERQLVVFFRLSSS